MSERTRKSRWARLLFPRSFLWILLGVCLACTSCVTGFLSGAFDRPPREWDGRRGPVVPHDNFPADCSLCHAGRSWDKIRDDFVFDHLAATGVPLRGAHAGAECLRCHNDRGPVGVFAQRGCAGCHEDIHQGQLGAECTLCHTENDWRPQGQLAEHNRTRFPLTGAHVAVACWRCHPGAQVGNFTRAPVECERCHQADLSRATSPNHLAAGWTTDCQRCHQPISWQGAGFVHSAFPLVGAHGAVDCKACHAGGAFGKLAGDCASCHLDDYRVTTAPNHQVLAYPTTCESCHIVSTWQGATFNHRFRINSGHHAGLSCQTCHQVPSNYSAVSCTHCHQHRQARMNNEHSSVSGYSWNSAACVSCHRTGSE
ncbi:MAG: cytochrome c3 family protein [Planctomycetota bacterium]